MPRIYHDVEVRYTVTQQLLLTTVLPPLPMVEEYVAVNILKSDGEK